MLAVVVFSGSSEPEPTPFFSETFRIVSKSNASRVACVCVACAWRVHTQVHRFRSLFYLNPQAPLRNAQFWYHRAVLRARNDIPKVIILRRVKSRLETKEMSFLAVDTGTVTTISVSVTSREPAEGDSTGSDGGSRLSIIGSAAVLRTNSAHEVAERLISPFCRRSREGAVTILIPAWCMIFPASICEYTQVHLRGL